MPYRFALAAAAATDPIEENPLPIEIGGCDLPLAIGPFEIRTLRQMLAEP
jgi:hypothetical protein